MDFGRSLLSAGVAVASWLATPSVSVSRPLAPSPTEADRSLPGDLLWSLDAFAPAPLDSAIPASASVLSPLAATSPALVRGAAGASRALSVSPSSSFSSSLSSRCASPAPDSLASPAPRPEDIGFRPTAFRRPRTVSAYQLAVQGYTGPLRREAKTPLRLRQRFNGNWGSMWPRPATPNGSWQGDSATLDGLNLPRPAAQPRRARNAAPAPRKVATVVNKENLVRPSTTPLAPPPVQRTAAPLRARNANVRTPGRFNAHYTGNDTEDTVAPGSCTPRAAPAAVGKATQPRVRMAPPPALPLAPLGPGSTTPTTTPTVRAPLHPATRSSSSSAPLALSSTPVRAAPYHKRRMSPPPPLASSSRATTSTPVRSAPTMASTPPRPRQDKGKARAVSPPPSLPSQDFTVGDETVMVHGNGDDNNGDDTVRTQDVELSQEVLAGLGMDRFPGLTLVQPRSGHTTGRLNLPSFGLPSCVVSRKAAAKPSVAKAPKDKATRTVTILSPPVSSAPAGSRTPSTPASAPRNLGKSIKAGASVQARATAMEELATVSGNTTSAPAPVLPQTRPALRPRAPSPSRPSSANAPMSKASQHIVAMLAEMDRQHESARKKGVPPPGCRPATGPAAGFAPGDFTARLEQMAKIRHYGPGTSDDSDSFDSFDSSRSSAPSGSSGKKRPASTFDWMHADVAPLDESLVQAFKKQRQLAPRRVFGRQDSLDRLASRQTSGSPIRLDAPRRRPAAVALRGAAATGPRLPPIPTPITVVKINGVVIMDLLADSPAPASRSFVHPAAVPPTPAPIDASSTSAPVDASVSADNTVASSSGSFLSFAARSFSLEAAKRSAKVKEAGRKRMAEVQQAVRQRRQRQDKERPQAQEAEQQQQPQRQPTTPKRKTSSSRPRSPPRSCRSQVESAARKYRLSVNGSSTNGSSGIVATNGLVQIVVNSPGSPSGAASPSTAPSSAFLAVPEQQDFADRAPAQLVEPLEADWSSDNLVVRAIWSPTAGLGPGFEDESLENVFITKCKPCDPTWFRRDADGDIVMKDVADCTC